MGLGAKLNVKDEMTMTVHGRPTDVDLDIDVDVVMTNDEATADAVLVFVADKAELAGR